MKAPRNLNPTIGAYVKNLRKNRELRQTAVAHAIGLNQATLSRVESGFQNLTAAQWVLFCEHLGILNDKLVKAVRRADKGKKESTP